MSDETIIKDPSPFPSASDMDLPMWRATEVKNEYSRYVKDGEDRALLKVFGKAKQDAARDCVARRMEMLGDLYETLRKLTETADKAGVDVTDAMEMLGLFCAPKPFSDTDGEEE